MLSRSATQCRSRPTPARAGPARTRVRTSAACYLPALARARLEQTFTPLEFVERPAELVPPTRARSADGAWVDERQGSGGAPCSPCDPEVR